MNLRHLLLLPLILAGIAATTAPAAEPPAALDTVEVTALKRTENAFRTIQLGMERIRSEKTEDADKIVCIRQKPVGSNIPIINCATNRYWERIRSNSLSNGIGTVNGAMGGGGGGSGSKQDQVFSISLNDYNKLKKQFGTLPKEYQDQR